MIGQFKSVSMQSIDKCLFKTDKFFAQKQHLWSLAGKNLVYLYLLPVPRYTVFILIEAQSPTEAHGAITGALLLPKIDIFIVREV
jgi:hypothetical protein